MAKKTVLGYNILFKIDGKTIVGTTQDDMEITANVKEVIYKSLQGNSEVSVTGHKFAFSAQGLMMLDDAQAPAEIDSDAMFEKALKNGSEAVLPFVYTRATGQAYKGSCVITSYKESAGSEDNATWNASFQCTGAVTKLAASGSGSGSGSGDGDDE